MCCRIGNRHGKYEGEGPAVLGSSLFLAPFFPSVRDHSGDSKLVNVRSDKPACCALILPRVSAGAGSQASCSVDVSGPVKLGHNM